MSKLRRLKAKVGWTLSNLVFLLSIIIFQLGCPSEPLPKECMEFFNTYAVQDERIFVGYDLEKQLAIYQCGLDQHPPTDYSYRIADRGKNIIPVLLEKLNRNDYKSKYDAEKTKYGIILIFQRLADERQVNDREIIKVLEQTVSEIKTEWIREEAEESLEDIKKNLVPSIN